jgi:hypothetical protein
MAAFNLPCRSPSCVTNKPGTKTIKSNKKNELYNYMSTVQQYHNSCNAFQHEIFAQVDENADLINSVSPIRIKAN